MQDENMRELCVQLPGRISRQIDALSNPDGSPLSPDNLSRDWHRACRSLGLPLAKFHALRHTHASALIAKGHDVVRELEQIDVAHGSSSTPPFAAIVPPCSRLIKDKPSRARDPRVLDGTLATSAYEACGRGGRMRRRGQTKGWWGRRAGSPFPRPVHPFTSATKPNFPPPGPRLPGHHAAHVRVSVPRCAQHRGTGYREHVPQTGRWMIRRCRGQSGANFWFVSAERLAKVLIMLDGDVAEWLKAAVC